MTPFILQHLYRVVVPRCVALRGHSSQTNPLQKFKLRRGQERHLIWHVAALGDFELLRQLLYEA